MGSVYVAAGIIAAMMACGEIPARAQALSPAESMESESQQEHLRSCNAEATSKSIDGDARDSFMRTCLSRKIGEGNLNVAQRKMELCTAQATEQSLQGEARASFLNTCLKPPPATPPTAAPAAS
jgi:hypothetical protein